MLRRFSFSLLRIILTTIPMRLHSLFLLIVMMLMSLQSLWAQNDTINRDDPDFVKASLLVASPGEVLYSCVGHACVRLECPAYNLDYCFSYEGEDVEHEFLRFFAGKLKMGMFAVPTAEYLQQYKDEQRGVLQYPMELPIDMKRRLWEILDKKVAEGTELPYDYFERGCAQTTIQFLMQAADTLEIQFAPWPEKYNLSCREIFSLQTKDHPWTNLALHTLMGTAIDAEKEPLEKVIVPADLVEVLRQAKINEKVILAQSPVELVKAEKTKREIFVNPLMIAFVFLFLALVVLICKRNTYLEYLFLAFQTVIGLVVCYLVIISDLPCTEWNWLVIPFNPLPVVFWKWRRYFALPYAAILALWSLVMFLSPHQLTDWSYVVLALALSIVYFRVSRK